jgi:exodeoxyribonuclease VII large subunit
MSDLFSQTSVEESSQILSQTSQITLELDFLNPNFKAKELISQIDWVITHRKTEFLTQFFSLKKHKSVQIRRKIATGIGILGKYESLFELKKWRLEESDRTTWLILDSTIDKLERGILGENLQKNVSVLSVTEAIRQIKSLVSEKIYIIEGELSDIKAIKQMYYFALKDSEDSRVDCWGFVGKIIKAGFPLNEGLSVRITGKFKLSKYSKIYFDIDKIELTGEGELLRNLKLLEEKLTKEGLFDIARKRKIKQIPQNILLIASLNSAAISDFLEVLSKRRNGLNIYFLPIKTQGIGAEIEILETLNLANDLITQNQEQKEDLNNSKISIDTVIMTRGGGSKDDLSVFNSERVVRAVHSLKKPIIVAIGHERDITLAELAADLRASTPSQAAELVSLSKNEIIAEVEVIYSSCQNYFWRKKKDYLVYSNSVFYQIQNSVQIKLQSYKKICNLTQKTLNNFLFQTKSLVQNSFQKIYTQFYTQLYQQKLILKQVDFLPNQISNLAQNYKKETDQIFSQILLKTNQKVVQIKKDLEFVDKNLQLYDPKNILKKGYAIVKQNNKIISTKKSFSSDSDLVLEFYDGEIKIK